MKSLSRSQYILDNMRNAMQPNSHASRRISAVAMAVALSSPLAAATPDERAKALEARMTPEEQQALVHGIMALPIVPGTVMPPDAIPGAGYVPGVPRLGIPALKETDASLGVSYVSGMRKDGATALPSAALMGATWNPDLLREGGAMIGGEARAKGFNVLLAGGVNLVRDPRNGRNFEYFGEDPLHSGILAGAAVTGVQSAGVISTVKHFAVNAQETGRQILNSKIGEAAARESDLLAFEIAIERGQPGAVMCAYNRVNGDYSCENAELLDRTLKRDWGYPGFVMSDWGAVHGVEAAIAGLDQQSGAQLDKQVWFGAPLKQKVASDPAYAARLRDMNRRILRSMIAANVIDNPPVKAAIDFEKNAAVARRVADEGIVLLRNRGVLPLVAGARSIAVIGGYADTGVLSGGGSSQVAEEGGPAAVIPMGGEGPFAFLRSAYFHKSPPLAAIRARAKGAAVTFNDGSYVADAARTAARADVAIVFATQWMMEGYDVADLGLPNGQDALIEAVAQANPNTIVVLQTGGPVLMPWLDKTAAVVEAWYPGARGGDAIAAVLFGEVNPSGKLPVTFPASYDQLPRPRIPGWDTIDKSFDGTGNEGKLLDVDYDIEGSDVGYRWFARKGEKPLFPFGHGLSYTDFRFGDLKLSGGNSLTARFTVTNSGKVAGKEVAQAYLLSGPQGTTRRLIGFAKVDLKPGESKVVTITADPRLLAQWDKPRHGWRLNGGRYAIGVGGSSADLPLTGEAVVAPRTIAP